jgi:hypothetical protein
MTTETEKWVQSERDRAAERLARVRLHAENIRAFTSTDAPKDKSGKNATNVRMWLALVVTHGESVSLKISKVENSVAYAEVQRRFSANSSLASQSISNQTIGLTGEQIAIFFGLDDVDPADVAWHEATVRSPSQLFIAQGGLNAPKLN